MSRVALVAVLLLCGCGVKLVDPCAGKSGTCINLQLTGSLGQHIDAVDVKVLPDFLRATHIYGSTPNGPSSLPVAMAIVVNPSFFGGLNSTTFYIGATGLLNGVPQGQGVAKPVEIGIGDHPRVEVSLDLQGDMIQFDDMSEVPPDMSPPPCSYVNVTTYAGTGVQGSDDGPAATAKFNYPSSLAVDAAYVYVADSYNNRIRKIRRSDSTVSTLIGNGYGDMGQVFTDPPTVIAVDGSGNLYVSNTEKVAIQKISPSGALSFVAGTGAPGYVDSTNPSAVAFGIAASIAVDGAGNLYIADTPNNCIRKVLPSGTTTTLAGNATQGYADGPGSTARFHTPFSLVYDGVDSLLVADNGLVRKVRVSDGETSTLNIGNLGTGGFLAYDRASGAVYLSTIGAVQELLSDRSTLVTLAGQPNTQRYADGNGCVAGIGPGPSIVLDGKSLFAAESSFHRIHKIDLP